MTEPQRLNESTAPPEPNLRVYGRAGSDRTDEVVVDLHGVAIGVRRRANDLFVQVDTSDANDRVVTFRINDGRAHSLPSHAPAPTTTPTSRTGPNTPVDGLDAAIARLRRFSTLAADQALVLAAGRAAWLVATALPGAQTMIFGYDQDRASLSALLEAVRGPAGELLWYGDTLADDPEAFALDAAGGPHTRRLDERTCAALDEMWAGLGDLKGSQFRPCTIRGTDPGRVATQLVALDVYEAIFAATLPGPDVETIIAMLGSVTGSPVRE